MTEIQIKHDGTIDLAIGESRWSENWVTTEYTWTKLLTELSTTQKTKETHARYVSLTKKAQGIIKDVGGFVGGALSGRRRKAGSVLYRQLITLDLDNAQGDEWEAIQLFFGFAACIYSTHKHHPKAPRYRLIIPLDRTVDKEEYQALARKVALMIGEACGDETEKALDRFDDSTYQPERLMYWPSTPKDVKYIFEYQDGPWLSADSILSKYPAGDWTDSTKWPHSSRVNDRVRSLKNKQGEPSEKPGAVGAFCRAYNIHDAIEAFLSDRYEPTVHETRYTYKEGSTAGGLVVYDDKFAYSHHGTDPTGGRLCNAFDLVRIHLYGDKDKDATEGTPFNRLPSFKLMTALSLKDSAVKLLVLDETQQSAKADFANAEFEPEPDEGEESDEWKLDLEVDKTLAPYGHIANLVLIFRNDPNLKNKMIYDDFSKREVVHKDLPWRKIGTDKYVLDSDINSIKHYLKTRWRVDASATLIEESLSVVFVGNRINPVREYLNSLVWDGVPRLDTLFIDYLGAEDTPYIRSVTRKTLTAAATRAFKPGTKFDYMLTLVGKQGIGKSTIISKLGGSWFSDTFSFSMLGSKEAYEQLQGAWLIEVGEMAGLKRAEVEAAKSFITSVEDRFRVAYGRRTSFFPRQCIFIGSTNNDTFLRDTTGNRRFWPVQTRVKAPSMNVFKDLTEGEIGQIWAEAMCLYRAGEPLHLDAKLEKVANNIQAEHTEFDEREGLVSEFLEVELPENWCEKDMDERRNYFNVIQDFGQNTTGKMLKRQSVCVAEIWCECMRQDPSKMNTHSTKNIHDIMRNLPEWKQVKRLYFPAYGKQICYQRIKYNYDIDAVLRLGI